MNLLSIENLMSLLLGIGLAASAGFRVFVPLFVLSLMAHFSGNLLLNENWQWAGSSTALIVLGVATLVEIIAYFIPVVDNFLDTISVPLAAVAGTLLMISTMPEMNKIFGWTLAIIAGGGLAATVSGATAATRAVSTGTTAGTGNFLVNLFETISAAVVSVVSFIWAPIAIILVLGFLYIFYRFWKTKNIFVDK